MLLDTSFRSDNVVFLTELYGNEVHPPLQENACWRSNISPHSQVAGSLVGVQP